MNWRDRNQTRPYFLEFIYSMEIVSMAYSEGFISWNVYHKALEKINSNMNSAENGCGLFEEGNEKIDFSKVYKD
jgi:hypothetical protein